MRSLIITALLIAFALADYPTPIVQCGKNTDLISFTSASLSFKPAKGIDNDILLKGVARDHVQITGVVLHTILNGVEAYQTPIDNKEVYDEGDPVQFKYANNFPSYTPSGHYQNNFIFLSDGVNVACGAIKFDL